MPPEVNLQGTRSLVESGLTDIAERGAVRELIPTHSALMGGWVYSGIFGLACWLLVAAILIYVLVAVLRGDVLPPVIVFVSILGVWNLAYSPFGGTTRLLFGITIAACLTIAGARGQDLNRGKTHGRASDA